jgi:hypothetical protein
VQETNNPNLDEAQTSIFPQEIDLTESNKKINNARGTLFFVAAAQFGMGIYEYISNEDKTIGGIAFSIDAFVASIFLVLALTTKKKPYISLLLALIAYILVVAAFGFIDPTNLAKGAVVKIFFTVALVKGVKAAKEAETLKTMAGVQ